MVKTRIRTLFRQSGIRKLRYLNNIYLQMAGSCRVSPISECIRLKQQEGSRNSIQPVFPQIIAKKTSCFPELFFNRINGSVKYFGYPF